MRPDAHSAQDRGPTADLGETQFDRTNVDMKKFDGQPFTAKLYAEMLKLAGVDSVLTVHNHSYSVQTMFSQVFGVMKPSAPCSLSSDSPCSMNSTYMSNW